MKLLCYLRGLFIRDPLIRDIKTFVKCNRLTDKSLGTLVSEEALRQIFLIHYPQYRHLEVIDFSKYLLKINQVDINNGVPWYAYKISDTSKIIIKETPSKESEEALRYFSGNQII